MILLLFAAIPALLWTEGPETAPALRKAGIQDIAVAKEAAAWKSTGIQATLVDPEKLEKLDAPAVDYQMSRASATAVPWIISNLWRMLRHPDRAYSYEVSGPAVALAVAEAYASGVPAYVQVKPADLSAYGAAVNFVRGLHAEAMPPRVNFSLVDDGSDAMEEVMNLLVRRNLLFGVMRPGQSRSGMVVRVGSRDYTKEMAEDPYQFAAVVRSKIGDPKRLFRIYGSDTVIARLYGDGSRSRLHLINYGRNPVVGSRVRVAGRFPRVLVASLGHRVMTAEDVVVDSEGTEFTIPEIRNYTVVDLDASQPGVLHSALTASNFALTADPAAPHWKDAPKVTFRTNSAGQKVPIGATEVRSRWTSDSLYLLFISPFDQLHLRSNPVTDRDTPQLWDWDVAEAFIGSDFEKIGQYREFQVSPQGEWVDLDIDVINPKPRQGMDWNSGYEVKARVDEARKIWYGEMRIPLSSIGSKTFRAGDVMRLGLFRCTGLPPERLYVAWQPAFRRTFHTPEAFGTLVLQ
jgi:hypothetical protein